jgi:hypothetical protein
MGEAPPSLLLWWVVQGKQWKQIIIIPRTPDFLSRLVALSNSMRLFLMKAAHAVLSDAA